VMSEQTSTLWKGISLGDVVRVVVVFVALIGAYYQVTKQVEANTFGVAANGARIEQVSVSTRADGDRMVERLKGDRARFEKQVLSQIASVKDDVRWLVRREVKKGGVTR